MADKMRLIDATEFHGYLEDIRQEYLEEYTLSSNFAAEVIETVQDEYLAKFPTVDAVPVVHARWEPRADVPGFARCSNCRDCNVYEDWPDGKKWNYCPNCGAKMDTQRRREPVKEVTLHYIGEFEDKQESGLLEE